MFTKLNNSTDKTGQKKSGSFTTGYPHGYPQYIRAWILDALFPVKCINCGRFPVHLKKEYLCKVCVHKITIRETLECIGCKMLASGGKTCFNCKDANSIDQLLILSDYKNPLVVKIIKLLKYRFIKEALEPISVVIKKYVYWLSRERKINVIEEDPVITFVPLGTRRLNWRGFNQAELIAGSLANILQRDVWAGILVQTKRTKPQAEVKERAERLNKLHGIFKITNSLLVCGRTVIVVDDVCTTGATLNECARILKEAGVEKVIGFVIARG